MGDRLYKGRYGTVDEQDKHDEIWGSSYKNMC